MTFKLQDTSPIIGQNSRLEEYWSSKGFTNFYTRFRKGKALPAKFHTMEDMQKIAKDFNLNSIGFGNWVTQEDRFNYLSALILSLYDIDQVLKFKNVGLNGTLSISFGARGSGRALAHFEPKTFIINITRYIDDPSIDKLIRFLGSGGAGSLAHEYGHAIDYYFGTYREPMLKVASLSYGRTTQAIVPVEKLPPVRMQMNVLINAINSTNGETKSAYRKRLEDNIPGDYIIRRNEIFARVFEQYIFYKLKQKGIANSFLHDTKYMSMAYMRENEFIRVLPEIEYLMEAFRQVL